MARKGDSSDRAASGERIAKVMARAGLCSRREAEAWIAAGRVAVNGKPIASPALDVLPHHRITVDGRPLPPRERTRLFLYHKPRGLLVSHADARGRPTVFAALPEGLPRLVSVGRLDLNTEGLLLLTNDGGLARTLELPATGWLRRYRVRAHGRVTQDKLDCLRDGIAIDGIQYGPIEARLEREQGANLWLSFAMREGKNREVKNVLGHLGLAVNRLIRVSFGPFQLGDLPEGAIAEVRTRTLRDQLGERIAARAGADFSLPLAEAAEPARERRSVEPPRAQPSLPPAPVKPRPRKRRPSDAERIGEPELARRQRRGRRGARR
jgi:23S rRNA pseudouridine2605 synthase